MEGELSMGLFNFKKDKKIALNEEQMKSICDYIEKTYGQKPDVFHEIESPDIHIDVLVISPTSERNYYTLITMGMSAYKMEIPQKYNGERLERCELMINLPANWNIHSQDENDYWPIRQLKKTARMPINNNAWLALGHTIVNTNYEPFASNTKLCGFSLASSPINNFWFRELEKVNFYTLVPLYREELEFSNKNGYPKLLDLFQVNNLPYPPIVDINRQNMCNNNNLN